MSEHDDLTRLIREYHDATPLGMFKWAHLADAIIDSGWHRTCPPRRLTFTDLEAYRNAALGRAEIQVNPELITDFDEVEIAPGMTVAAPRPNHHPACQEESK